VSIVEKTLQRLDRPGNTAPGAPPVAAPPHTVERDLLYVAGGARQRRRPWALWLALLLLAGTGLLYFGLLQMGPATAPLLSAGSLGQAVQAPRPAIEAVSPEPAATPVPVLALPDAAAQVPTAAPAPMNAPLPTPLPAPLVAAATNPALPPPWLLRGWEAVPSGGLMQALPIWEQGALTLPDQQLLIVGHAFLDRHGMNAALARRDLGWAVFAVRQTSAAPQGQAAQYRVVVLVPPKPAPGLLEAVAARFGRADWLSAAALKQRLPSAQPQLPVATTAADPSSAAAPVALAQAQPPRVPGAPVVPVPPAADLPPPAQPQWLQLPVPPAGSAAATGPADAAPAAPARSERRDWENRANQVRELLRQGAFVQVAEQAEGLSRDFPDRWEPWFWLGTAALARGQLAPAEQALERSLALNAGAAQVWVQRGIVAQERGDHAAAVRFLSQAVAQAPRMPEAHLNLGFSFDALGRTSEAERSFRAFLHLTEGNAVYALQRQHIQGWLARR